MATTKQVISFPPATPHRLVVGIYCRVSSESQSQLVSVAHQMSGLITNVANSNLAKLYDVYLDVQSGRSADNRRNLMRLLDDCRSGNVNLVYTKSLSRFARNTLDALTIVQELKRMKVPVYFETENIFSFDKDAEFQITLHEVAAQNESKSKSENIKWRIDKAAQNSDSKIYNRKCYGYNNADDGTLVINEEEAAVVRKIYELYLDGFSAAAIRKYLEHNNILSSTGKPHWCKKSIDNILTNEKYVGDVLLYKTFSPDYPEKKRIKNNGEHKKYLISDHHPAIITREMFTAVQEMRTSRSNIERNVDGTVTRKATRYTGKKE